MLPTCPAIRILYKKHLVAGCPSESLLLSNVNILDKHKVNKGIPRGPAFYFKLRAFH